MKIKFNLRKAILYFIPAALLITLLCFLIWGYIKSQPQLHYAFNPVNTQSAAPYPDARFAVISDLHYYDSALGITGPAFEACLYSDRKLLKDSDALLNLAIDDIIKSNIKFVLVTGDLTKDGELLCHQKVATALSRLTQNGIKVYVVPGNHDIDNPGACKYEGSQSIPVASITAEQFEDIYKDCGYGSTISRDANSLSYVAEPVDNLWVVALDACRYKENKPGKEETISGKLSQSQEQWLEDMLREADQSKKAVILMEHHGLVEHWTGQSKLHPDFLIQDYKYAAELLASYHVRLAFTGHYHAQDITLADFNNNGRIYDIETGSLVTAPCPVRYCATNGNKLKITSKNLVGDLHPGTDFEKNADQFVLDTLEREAYLTLREYLVPENDAHSLARFIAVAFAAHYRGDENPSAKPAFDEANLGLVSRIVYSAQKYVVEGLWKDLPPADNNVVLDLN